MSNAARQRFGSSPPAAAASPHILQRRCACGGTPGPTGECEECSKKRLELQRRASAPTGLRLAPPIVHEVLRSPGKPLDPATRGTMESRLGHDFSRVRVHDDPLAARSAQAVGAQAYTVGADVAFSNGLYQPQTVPGRRLLAHELTHVAQQSRGAGGGRGDERLPLAPAGGPLEAQAERAAGLPAASPRADPNPAPRSVQRRMNEPGFPGLGEEGFPGSTLPYREAKELAACMRIMKDSDYCREEVLGEKPIRPSAGCGWFGVNMKTTATGVEGTIEFTPSPKHCPKCNLIRLVQVVRVFESPGVDYKWPGAEAPREKVKTKKDKKKGILPNYFVDHSAAGCSKGGGCSVYYRDHWANAASSQDGSNDGTTAKKASLWDGPSGDANDVFEFETCARCHDDGSYLGCVTWGFKADAAGKVSLTPTSESGSTTATFDAAVAKFDKYYKNP